MVCLKSRSKKLAAVRCPNWQKECDGTYVAAWKGGDKDVPLMFPDILGDKSPLATSCLRIWSRMKLRMADFFGKNEVANDGSTSLQQLGSDCRRASHRCRNRGWELGSWRPTRIRWEFQLQQQRPGWNRAARDLWTWCWIINSHSLISCVDKAHVSCVHFSAVGGYVFRPHTMGVRTPDVLPKGWMLFDGQAAPRLAWSVVPCHKRFGLGKPSDFQNQSSRAVVFLSDQKKHMVEVGPTFLRN